MKPYFVLFIFKKRPFGGVPTPEPRNIKKKGFLVESEMSPVSPREDAMLRGWIADNNYKMLVEHRKLLLAWLQGVPTATSLRGALDDGELLSPVPFFVRKACWFSIFDRVVEWMGPAEFAEMTRSWAPNMWPHEVMYFRNLGIL